MYEYSQEQLKGLAAETDASLSQARAALASNETQEEAEFADSLFNSINYALKINESYRVALFSVLETHVERLRHLQNNNKISSQVTACAEGILLVCVSAIWLYAKKDDPSGALKVAFQDAQKLASLLGPSPSVAEPRTIDSQMDILTILKDTLSPPNEALKEFLHSWDVVRWIHGDATELKFHSDDPAENSSALSDCKCQIMEQRQHNLRLKQDLFQAIILHYEVTRKIHHDREEEKWQRRRARDRCLEQHTLSDSSLFDNSKIRRLQCLFRLVDAFNLVQEKAVLTEELDSCLREVTENPTDDAATLNLIGCVLASSTSIEHAALEFFQKSLNANPNRLETIVNVIECLLRLGKTEQAQELLLLSLHLVSTEEQPLFGRKTSFSHSISFDIAISSEILQRRLLWWAFLVASLTGDTERLLQSASDMNTQGYRFSGLGDIFALLQSGRPSAALKKIAAKTTDPVATFGELDNALIAVFHSLYEADCILELELHGQNGVPRILFLCKTAMQLFRSDLVPNNAPCTAYTELQVILYNNMAVSYMMEGKAVAALECLEEACHLAERIRIQEDRPLSLTLLQPHFNLALYHMQGNNLSGALKTWRGGRHCVFSNEATLLELKAMLNEAIQCHYESINHAENSSASLHVPSWKPGLFDEKQVYLMDCITLQAAIEMRQTDFVYLWDKGIEKQS